MKKHTLINTHDIHSYEDYKENCVGNDLPIQDELSNHYWDFVADMRAMEWDDFMLDIKHCKCENRMWAITGSLGLWWGTPDIEPTFKDSLSEAIFACINGCDDFVITKKCSAINITAMHHDGRNNFTLRCLSDIGRDRYMRNGKIAITNKYNIKTLNEYLF